MNSSIVNLIIKYLDTIDQLEEDIKSDKLFEEASGSVIDYYHFIWLYIVYYEINEGNL